VPVEEETPKKYICGEELLEIDRRLACDTLISKRCVGKGNCAAMLLSMSHKIKENTELPLP
jgi:hypothetical protein